MQMDLNYVPALPDVTLALRAVMLALRAFMPALRALMLEHR